jgi:aminoglycoside phosphotransferase (APT) family kinase protein
VSDAKVVTGLDPARIRSGLEEWLSRRGADDAKVSLLPGPQATGYSHETIVFDLTHDGHTQRLIARVEPGEVSVFPAPDLNIEYRLLEAIAPDGITLPKLHGFESNAVFLGRPFYVMEHIAGEVPSDTPPYTFMGWLHEATSAVRESVWWSGLEALSKVHQVDWKARDLGFIVGDRPEGLAGEFEYWRTYGEFCGGLAVVAERALDWVIANAPADTDVALCWGDSRLGNQMFRDGRCVALLDWEMATLSDPVEDLAWFIYFDELYSGGSHLEGFPGRAPTIARYEELTGAEVRNFEYFYVLAAFRFTAIMQRLGTLLIEAGKLPADSTFPSENFASEHLAKLCEEKGIR